MSKTDPFLVSALKTLNELLLDSRFTGQFQAPVNKELLTHKLSLLAAAMEEESGDGGSAGSTQQYTDYLLPLPESLIPTELGAPHPDVINDSRAARGMNTKINSNSRQAQEQRLAQKLQKKLGMKNSARPKLGLMPTPFGTRHKEED